MNRALAAIALSLALLPAAAGTASTAAPAGSRFSVAERAQLHGERVGSSVFTAAQVDKDCDVTTFSGFLAGNSPTLELEPAFDDCTAKALSGLSVKWVISGCTFFLHRPRQLTSGERWRSEVDLRCPGELPTHLEPLRKRP